MQLEIRVPSSPASFPASPSRREPRPLSTLPLVACLLAQAVVHAVMAAEPAARRDEAPPPAAHSSDLTPTDLFGKPEPAAAALRTIAEVFAQPPAELERSVAVRLRGVVTMIRPALCIQDGELGIYCIVTPSIDGAAVAEADDGRMVAVEPSMLIEAEGVALTGGYAPNLRARWMRILGKVPLPEPQPIDVGRLMRGGNSGTRVQVGGQPKAIVRGQLDLPGEWSLNVEVAGRRLLLRVPKKGLPAGTDELVDAEIRAVGVIGSFRNNRGEFLEPQVVVGKSDDFLVTKPAPATPFAAPRLPLLGLATYRTEPLDGHRVCVEGVVNCVVPGRFCILQEGRAGVRIDCRDTAAVRPGDRVVAAGFIAMNGPVAGLVEAVLDRTGAGTPPEPIAIAPHGITAAMDAAGGNHRPLEGNYDNALIMFPARLLERRRADRGWAITLSTGSATVIARLHEPAADDDARMAALEIGSDIVITGVSQVGTTSDSEGTLWGWSTPPGDAQLILRSAADIAVVRRPPWWTPRRLAALLGLVGMALVVAAAWAVLLRRQVRVQSLEMAEKIRSSEKERIEYETALRERNRLAANLHDTVLQTVTGISYQLQVCQAGGDQPAGDAAKRIAVAARMANYALQQLRGTVWALHAMPTGHETLAASLDAIVARLREGHSVPIRCRTDDVEPPLSELLISNLLLVAQEAITNALRHAAPRLIEVTLRHDGAAVVLTVADDGRGFIPGRQPCAREGHFGIEGMYDRVQGIGGECRFESGPGRGTTFTATVRVAAPDGDPSDRTVTGPVVHGSMPP
jgi:signal transduction histidine kinase